MIWRTCGSDSISSARSAYSTRAVGLTRRRRRQAEILGGVRVLAELAEALASFVAVPSDGIRSPRISREIVEWSTPDCCASWRCDIFFALSWARSHSLNARPFWVVVIVGCLAPWLPRAEGAAMPALSGLNGPCLYHPLVPNGAPTRSRPSRVRCGLRRYGRGTLEAADIEP